MTRKLRVTIHEFDDRPSGHQVSPNFLATAINHKETIGCPCEHEHALFLMRILDVMAYDCGVRRGEFKEIPEVTKMMATLAKVVDLIPKEHDLDADKVIPDEPASTGTRAQTRTQTKLL